MPSPYRPTLLLVTMRAPYPADELAHFVGLWSHPERGRRGKLTRTIGGLVYVLASPNRDLIGYRLIADGVTYDGPDAIRGWADTHVPRSLEIARQIRAGYPAAAAAPPCSGWWSTDPALMAQEIVTQQMPAVAS